MAHVPLIETAQAPLLARPYYADGDPGPIVRALAHVPEYLEVAMPFLSTVLGASALDSRTKELVILRTSAVAGCRYCIGTHTVVALETGLAPDEVRALRGELPLDDAFADPSERQLLAWVDVVTTGEITDAARETIAGFYDDADVVDLTVVASTTLLLNRLCTAFDFPLSDETVEGLRRAGMP